MKLSLVLPLLALLTACSRPADSPPPPPTAATPVRVATVIAAVTPRTQPVAGTIRPFEHAVIAARVTGTVTLATLAVGQPVRAGDLLVVLQADELAARVEQARAASHQAGRDYERERSLESQGASTPEAVRTAIDRQLQAQAALQEVEVMLAYTRITAPFHGIVTGDFINPGDFAAAGQPLFELEGTDRMRAEVQVPESLPVPGLGTTLMVQWDDVRVTGRLAEISPAADPGSRSRLAKIDLPAGTPAGSGRFVRVLWPAGSQSSLVIPVSAVAPFGQMERVFTIAGGRATLRLVKSGATNGDQLEILAGLDAGETVILSPPAGLRDGQPVEILP